MDHPRLRGWAVLRHLAVPALALAVVATLPMTRPRPRRPPPPARARLAPASVSYGLPHGETVKGQFLSYNDFHGAIDPPTGSGAAVNGTPGRRRRIPGDLAEEAARRGQRPRAARR